MKFSRYNTFQPLEDKVLGFNTYSGRFMLLEPLLYDLIKSAMHHNEAEQIAHFHTELYDGLLMNQFIVDDVVDEFELVKEKMWRTISNSNEFRLIINPTMNCNFKCWYCYETHIKDSRMDDANLVRLSRFVENILNTGIRHLQISFFGGEPMLYYAKIVVPILEHAVSTAKMKNINISVDFTSNGYLIDDSMIDTFKRLHVNNFQITLDGHKELHDKIRFVSATKGSYEKILKNIYLLSRNQIEVNVRVNYTQDNFLSIPDILEDLARFDDSAKKFITVSLHKVWQDKDLEKQVNLYEIVEGLKEKINLLGLKNIPAVSIDAVAYACYADKINQATVNYNGDVFKCTARDFKTSNRAGKLTENGEVDWNADYAKRFELRLKNKPCLECSILPVCGGGCSQLAIENESKDYCVNDFDESKKMNVVRDIFISSFYE